MSDDTGATTSPTDKHARYNRSEKGRERMRRYFDSAKGQKARFYGHLREAAAGHQAKRGTTE